MKIVGLVWRSFASMVLSLGGTSLASAQAVPSSLVPPKRATDARGVDLFTGSYPINIPLVSFGKDATSLSASLELSPTDGGWVSTDFMTSVGYLISQAIRPRAHFILGNGSMETGFYTNVIFPDGSGYYQDSWGMHTNPDGSTYTQSFGPSHFTKFTSPDPNQTGIYNAAGARGTIGAMLVMGVGNNVSNLGLLDKIVLPNGEEWRFFREFATVRCEAICSTMQIARVRSIVSSRGYAMQFLYVSDAIPSTPSVAGSWYAPRHVTAYNKAKIPCDESLLRECPAVTALPSADIIYDPVNATVTVHEPGAIEGIQLTIAKTNSYWGYVSSVKHTAIPGSTVSFQVTSDNTGQAFIQKLTDSDGIWNYSRLVYVDDSGRTPRMVATSTNPKSGIVQITGYNSFGQLESYTDENQRYFSYGSGYPYRSGGVFLPEGDTTGVEIDARNNITSIVRYPKPNTTQSPSTVYSALYPTDCSNPKTCNKPIYTLDGNNNRTDYAYAPEHGGVVTETGPAVNGVRPQQRFTYAQRYPWVLNSSGAYVRAAAPIWVLTGMSSCKSGNPNLTNNGCTNGPSDEVTTTYDYGPDTGPNNLILRGTVVDTGGLAMRTCYSYDSLGNRISDTKPRAGLTSCP